MSSLTVRPYQPGPTEDAALRDICLRTGDNGTDASSLYALPWLLAAVYLDPYLKFHPHHCIVIADGDTPVGYAVGTPDTTALTSRLAEHWWPQVLNRVAQVQNTGTHLLPADHALVTTIHQWALPPASVISSYPAHLHIDLLDAAQGGGWGRRAINELLTTMRQAHVPGIHLGVSAANTRAQGFYTHIGFTVVAFAPWGSFMGMSLTTPPEATPAALHSQVHRKTSL